MESLKSLISQRLELEATRKAMVKEHESALDKLDRQIKGLKQLEALQCDANLDTDKIGVATGILSVYGDIYGRTQGDSITIAEAAINDLVKGCPHLKQSYFGNKVYGGYYQRDDHTYGYGPAHGSTRDEIALKQIWRDTDLTEHQVSCCIYYLRNYNKVAAATSKV